MLHWQPHPPAPLSPGQGAAKKLTLAATVRWGNEGGKCCGTRPIRRRATAGRMPLRIEQRAAIEGDPPAGGRFQAAGSAAWLLPAPKPPAPQAGGQWLPRRSAGEGPPQGAQHRTSSLEGPWAGRGPFATVVDQREFRIQAASPKSEGFTLSGACLPAWAAGPQAAQSTGCRREQQQQGRQPPGPPISPASQSKNRSGRSGCGRNVARQIKVGAELPSAQGRAEAYPATRPGSGSGSRSGTATWLSSATRLRAPLGEG